MRIRHIFVPAAVLAVALLSGCSSNTPTDATSAGAGSSASSEQTPAGCGYTEAPGGVRDVTLPAEQPTVSGTVAATMSTNVGDIHLTLDADRTPCTVGSFASLAEQKYYDDTTCHRLTTTGIYVLQCGDPSATGMGGPGYSYADELDGSETYPAGTVAMANAGPNTNGSQFFLVYQDTQLSPDYTVFGTMDEASIAIVKSVAEKGLAADGTAPAQAVDITAVTID